MSCHRSCPLLLAATLSVVSFHSPPLLAAFEPWKAQDLLPVTFHPAPDHPPIPLFENGTSTAMIAIPVPRPPRDLLQAAQTLNLFFRKTSGTILPVTNRIPEGPALVLGPCPESAALGLDPDAMPVEGFTIRTSGNKIFIVGNTNSPHNGAIWGVYEFAERFLGIRWYLPMPQEDGDDLGICALNASTLAVPPVWLEDAPVFRHRDIWPDTSEPSRGAGLNMRPLHHFLRDGNSWPIRLQVHTPNWSRFGDYTNSRPEVFQLKRDGTRDWNVLCYSNPKTLETYLEQIQNFLDGKPYRLGILNGNAITVSPADVELACYCPECRAAWDPEGGALGTASKIMASFTDKLARTIKARWPDHDFTVIFLPYLNYTKAPSGFRFPGNVEVQLCGMPGLALYKEPAIFAAEQANIDAWLAITGRKIQNWHYSVWPAHKTKAAYQYPHVIQRFYRENRNKTVGTFINGEFNHWPRQHISLYIWMKCLWNPDFPVDAAIETFCQRLFGPAASHMRELIGLQISRWEESRWPDGRFSPRAIYEISFPREIVLRMEALFAQARQAAQNDPLVTKRLDYLAPDLLAFFEESKQFAEGTGFTPLLLQKIGDPPHLDGKLDDEVWQQAQPVSFVTATGPNRGKPAKYPTTLRGLWTAEGIWLGFHMTEPTPDRLETRHGGHDNGEVWWDDNVELFLDPSGDNAGEFYQIILNADLATLDNRNKDLSWECKGLQAAAHRGSDFWSLEIFLPFSAFPNARIPPPGAASQTVWYGNFTRHRVADCTKLPLEQPRAEGSTREYQRMNTTGSVASDNLADFAPIRFVE